MVIQSETKHFRKTLSKRKLHRKKQKFNELTIKCQKLPTIDYKEF